MSQYHNLYATVLTYAAPSSNYRGESEENRTVLQKITRGGLQYTVISPESMRNALREILTAKGLPMNRRRLHDEDQLAVEFKDFPNAELYADDFLFGFLVADTKTMKKHKLPAKRDSVVRMNLAVALSPYRYDATFHQSPLNAGGSPWKNAGSSALLHREIAHTAYQYPLALCGTDCAGHEHGPTWTRSLLEAVGELSGVAGGHARSYFEMSPKSVVARLTPRLVAGFDTYGFVHRDDGSDDFPELDRVGPDDLPGDEMWIGGALARDMDPARKQALTEQGVHFYDSPQRMLADLSAGLVEARA
ncbi:type I-B CRISPR-associated protein Cas7/Cst2/DevR [Haliangium sp.]|uniref:type I-B CRISPR-associated protein Cas7/Cst2/DevR n=1 Tax=Haliangium sp. TaxID=2663208 RepID=UPI003D0D470F